MPKSILLAQLKLCDIQQTQVSQPEFVNHKHGKDGKDGERSWGQVSQASGGLVYLFILRGDCLQWLRRKQGGDGEQQVSWD